MKKIGLIGGTGPETTVRYYRALLSAMQEQQPQDHLPEMTVESMDCGRVAELSVAGRELELAAYLTERVRRVAAAGAEVAAFAGMTAHKVFAEVVKASPVPLVHIADGVAAVAREKGWRRLGLVGGAAAMREDFAAEPLMAAGMTVVRPAAVEQEFIAWLCAEEIEFGRCWEASVSGFRLIVQRLVKEEGIEALYLANTDFGGWLEGRPMGIPLLDPVPLHIKAIAKEVMK